MPVVRRILSLVLAVIFPLSLQAQDRDGAMLHTAGKTSVNGNTLDSAQHLDSLAIFPGDKIQTDSGSEAQISPLGTSVLVRSDTAIRYYQGSVEFNDNGIVSISSTTGFTVRAGRLTVKPETPGEVRYIVTKRDCRVDVKAVMGDLTINRGSRNSTLKEGKETRDDDACPAAKKSPGGAEPGATGTLLSSKAAIIAGTAAAAGGLVWVLVQGDDPMSQDCPTKQCN